MDDNKELNEKKSEQLTEGQMNDVSGGCGGASGSWGDGPKFRVGQRVYFMSFDTINNKFQSTGWKNATVKALCEPDGTNYFKYDVLVDGESETQAIYETGLHPLE